VVVRPFAAVELDFYQAAPHPPHTEDYLVDPSSRIWRGMLPAAGRQALLDRTVVTEVAQIFGTTVHHDEGWFVTAGEGNRSLASVRPEGSVEIYFSLWAGSRWDYRVAFVDRAGELYRLPVTDLAFRCYLDRLRDDGLSPARAAQRLSAALQDSRVYLRVGLARRWVKHPERCYLQITGVHTFPDYLGGRCFADLQGSAGACSPPALATEAAGCATRQGMGDPPPGRAQEKWTPEEEDRLRLLAERGLDVERIALAMKRRPGVIVSRLNMLRLVGDRPAD
jgi:hypothetical protein